MDEIKKDLMYLKNMIDSDIESVGGVERFNNYCCANECITSWMDNLIDIVEDIVFRLGEKNES